MGQEKNISRYISAPLKKAVFLAAGGHCCYVDSESTRSEEKKYIRIDHSKSFAMGGDHSLRNPQVLCKSHNPMRARDDFGAVFIQSKTQARQIVGNLKH